MKLIFITIAASVAVSCHCTFQLEPASGQAQVIKTEATIIAATEQTALPSQRVGSESINEEDLNGLWTYRFGKAGKEPVESISYDGWVRFASEHKFAQGCTMNFTQVNDSNDYPSIDYSFVGRWHLLPKRNKFISKLTSYSINSMAGFSGEDTHRILQKRLTWETWTIELFDGKRLHIRSRSGDYFRLSKVEGK